LLQNDKKLNIYYSSVELDFIMKYRAAFSADFRNRIRFLQLYFFEIRI